MKKLVPHDDKIVIKAPKQPENKAGIVLHKSSQDRPLMGTIIAAGESCKYYHVGDEVAYTRFNINEVELDGETFFVMDEKQILTAVEDK